MKTLVIVEHNNDSIKQTTYSTITAASKISEDVYALILGHNFNAAVEELKKSEFYQKLKEQDRTQYLSELEHQRILSDTVVITEDGNKLPSPNPEPLRNEAGFFIAVEDPFEENVNLKDQDQLITLEQKTTTYVYDPYWNQILDREFKEL